MKIHFFILIFVLVLINLTKAQQLSGTVYFLNEKGKKETLAGVNVYFEGTTLGTTTNEKGQFKMAELSKPTPLVFSFVGFKNDTLLPNNFSTKMEVVLISSVNLNVFEVEYRRKSSEVSLLNPLNITSVSEQELRKAACCNLSESFETNASIDASFTDGVTGTRQIKMLGLAGRYAQIMQDNIPDLRGLSTLYGLTYIPGPWIGSIQIAKGVGSVVNGYESITGQINVDIKEPFDSEKFHLNMYGNQAGRVELNTVSQHKVGKNIKTNLLVHGKTLNRKVDHNGDTFVDNPLEKDYVVSNLWRYRGDGNIEGEFGLTHVSQNHQSGQQILDPEAHTEHPLHIINPYLVNTINNRTSAFLKVGYIGKEQNSIGFQAFASGQKLKSTFGKRVYTGNNNTLFLNLITQTNLKSKSILWKNGLSFLGDKYEENIENIKYNRTELVPGVFTELTINKGNWSAIAGLRGDYHNIFGFFATPRLHLRYMVTENTSVKVAAGKGQRTPNFIADNIGIMASSRNIIIETTPANNTIYGGLLPEIAYNYGLNLVHKFSLNFHDGDISADFYRTDFINQLVMDVDQNPQQAIFYNLNGKSFSNSFQVEANYEVFKRFDARVAYRWMEVKTEFKKGLRDVPQIAKHRTMVNLAYETKPNKNKALWKFDVTALHTGKQRLPETLSNPINYQLKPYSDDFVTLNAQVTRVFGEKFQFYLGGENLTNYRQPTPIVGFLDPFGKYFDSSMVWGPIFGAMAYVGLRYEIK